MTSSSSNSKNGTRVVVEVGTKRAFASAADWPGWCRSGKNEAVALEALASYAMRYATVATAAVAFPPDAAARFKVIERVPGSAATEFGVPGSPALCDSEPMSGAETDRMCALVAAVWTAFDSAVKKAPAELRKGPRGGGRDRDEIVDHVLGSEVAYYAPKLGLKLQQPPAGDRARITENRQALLAAFRTGADGKVMRERGWSARYAARRIAWHALDHLWEMEDRS